MRKQDFRAFLAPRLVPAAVSSYASNAAAVERLLAVDLDAVALDDPAVEELYRRLHSAGMSPARARDCRSVLRQYATFRRAGPATAPPAGKPEARQSGGLADASVAALMRLYADVLDELRRRKVARTGNGPVGDYAEHLFATAFGWTLAPNSATGHDAENAAGVRYQIKARRVLATTGSRQLGAIRRLDDRCFDTLAAVLFDRRLAVQRAALIPYAVVRERARRVEHTNSWRFMLSDAVWDVPGVVDATAAIRAAAGG